MGKEIKKATAQQTTSKSTQAPLKSYPPVNVESTNPDHVYKINAKKIKTVKQLVALLDLFGFEFTSDAPIDSELIDKGILTKK